MKHGCTFFKLVLAFFLIVGGKEAICQQVSIMKIEPNPACNGGMITITGANLDSVENVKVGNNDLSVGGGQATYDPNTGTITVTLPSNLNNVDVNIVVEDTDGGAGTATAPLRINDIPNPTFSDNEFPDMVCVGEVGLFSINDISGLGGDFYHWNFGIGNTIIVDGNPISGGNPVSPDFSYTSAGEYPISVWVIDDGCSSDTLKDTITVHPSPVARFESSPSIICTGVDVTFNAQSVPGNNIEYIWRVGNGTSNTTQLPSYTRSFSNAGERPVYLTVRNTETDCEGYDTITIDISRQLDASIVFQNGTDENVCDGEPVTMEAKPDGQSYLWSTGDNSQSISIIPTEDQSYTVTVSGNCMDDSVASVNIDVHPLPEVSLGSDTTICEDEVLTLTANANSGTSPYSYIWTTGSAGSNNSIEVSPTGGTSYGVKVLDAQGCTDSTGKKVEIVSGSELTLIVDGDTVGGELVQVYSDIGHRNSHNRW